jgi:stage II sporulation protein P
MGRQSVAVSLLDFELSTDGYIAARLFGSPPSRAAEPPDTETSHDDAQSETPPPQVIPTPPIPAPIPTPAPQLATPEPTPDGGGLFYSGGELSRDPDMAARDNKKPLPADGIIISNNSTFEFDITQLLREPLGLTLERGKPAVLIIHTHSSEAFTREPGDTYAESDPYRTEDKGHSIIKVGDELAAALTGRGIGVIHDREIYDYPSYTGSYARSGASVEAYLEKYPSIKLVIDLHRDAISGDDGTQYKTIAQIGDTTCSQVMLVLGSGSAGLEHPNWHENLKLALRLQVEMNVSFPTLARPVTISANRYNQQLAPGALIVEIGCTGNTLGESVAAARYFADAYANVALGMYAPPGEG